MANTMTPLREIPSGSLSGDESSGDIIIDLVRTANPSKLDQELPLKEENLRCPDCSYSCSDSSTLATHIFSRTDGTPWKCEECSFKSCTNTDLFDHKRNVHSIANCNANLAAINDKNKSVNSKKSGPEMRPLFKCDRCSFVTYFLGAHNEHKRCRKAGHGQCSECDYTCCSLTGLKRHMMSQHGSLSEIKCLLCPFATIVCAKFMSHGKMHRRCRGYPLKCKDCSATFSKPSFLQIHSRIHVSNP